MNKLHKLNKMNHILDYCRYVTKLFVHNVYNNVLLIPLLSHLESLDSNSNHVVPGGDGGQMCHLM